MNKRTYSNVKSLFMLGAVFMLTSCVNPQCGTGYSYCPNPAGLGGTCCSASQYCASTGGQNPGPVCYTKPLLDTADKEPIPQKKP